MKIKFKKIGISVMIVGFLLVGTQAGSALPQNPLTKPMATAGWLYVGGGGPGNYTTIQSAIDAALEGDTIYVYPGTYNENIIIDKPLLTLRGAGRDITTIQGNNLNATIELRRQNFMIQGFTIKNDGSQTGIYTITSASVHSFTDNIFTMTSRGIHLFYSSENTITGNLFYDNTNSGAYLEIGNNNTISDNEFYNNTDNGIFLTGCGAVFIENNTFRNNGNGIHGYNDNGNIIRNNVIESNSYGIFLTGAFTVNSNWNTIDHNRINNNTIYGIRIVHSQFNTIEHNEIIGNGIGISFEYTGANIIRENIITFSDVLEMKLTFSLGDLVIKNNIDNTQQRLVLLQMGFGFVIAPNNWWGSTQWPLRRMRPIGGWVWIFPWSMTPFNLSVGPQ